MQIESCSWGNIKVSGGQSFKDCKIWKNKAKEWDWNITGTRHIPGIQFSDVEEILSNNVDVLVLSKGMENRLQVPDDTINAIKDRGVKVYIEQTENAVKLYNQLVTQGINVGGLFHSTC